MWDRGGRPAGCLGVSVSDLWFNLPLAEKSCVQAFIGRRRSRCSEEAASGLTRRGGPGYRV
jgi:hypothetical protein